MIKKILLTIFVLLVFVLAAFFIFNKIQELRDKKELVSKINETRGEGLGIWVNNLGVGSGRVHGFEKGEEIVIGFSRVKKETAEKLIDLEIIRFEVEGANFKKDFEPYYEESGLIIAKYKSNNPGIDKISVYLDGTDVRFEASIVILDHSFFTAPINLKENDINFSKDGLLQLYSVDSFEGGSFDFMFGKEYSPGYLDYKFKVNDDYFALSSLRMYPIEEGSLEKYNSEDPEFEFRFLRTVNELKKDLSEKSEKITVGDFPPVNASRGEVSHVEYIEFENGTGVRYIVPGYFQAVDTAEFPTYFFKGITNDGRYYVSFKYSKLYSPKLDNYIKYTKIPDYKNRDAYMDYIKGSFTVLPEEYNFRPSLEELDNFIKSIEINERI